MTKLKSLKILEITLSGFRTYKEEKTITSDDTTLIIGDNDKGKSSIAHAIAYALYGVSAFGVQDMKNILNEESKTVTVKLKFANENGEVHELYRSRTADTTTLTLGGFKVTQKQVDSIFGEKNIFLSLFNPSYFIEVLGGKGKEMLQLKLPIVKKERVLAKLSENEKVLLANEELVVPDGRLQKLRSEKNLLDEDLTRINGQLEAYGNTIRDSKTKKSELISELAEINAKLDSLVERQFEGINIDELKIERAFLDDKIKSVDKPDNDTLLNLQNRLYEAENREYEPKFQDTYLELVAELKVCIAQFNDVKSRLENLKIGDCCPTCYTEVTEKNLPLLSQKLSNKKTEFSKAGKTAQDKRKEVAELEKKSKDAFIEFRKQDIQNLTAQISDLQQKTEINETYRRIAEIDDLLKYGNLTAAELTELNCLKADKLGTEIQIAACDDNSREAEYKKALAEKAEIEEKIIANDLLISAVKAYIAKRSQISLSTIQMPNVKIQFHEFIKTTGELKDCYRFTYKGLDYSVLSLSSKIRAGLEVSAMLRKLYELDFPIFIDNSESIGNLSESELPPQTFIMRYVNGAELTVKQISNKVSAPTIVAPEAPVAA